MPSHRSLRFAEAIREVVSSAILFEVADPRVRAVTVLRVEVAGDLRNATVYVSVMGTPAEQKTALKGLKSATGFLQAKVAARLQTRSTPALVFKADESVKRSVEMSKLIEDTLTADRQLKLEVEAGLDEEPRFEDEAEKDDGEPGPDPSDPAPGRLLNSSSRP